MGCPVLHYINALPCCAVVQDKKKAEEERAKELADLFAMSIKQPKVPPGGCGCLAGFASGLLWPPSSPRFPGVRALCEYAACRCYHRVPLRRRCLGWCMLQFLGAAQFPPSQPPLPAPPTLPPWCPPFTPHWFRLPESLSLISQTGSIRNSVNLKLLEGFECCLLRRSEILPQAWTPSPLCASTSATASAPRASSASSATTCRWSARRTRPTCSQTGGGSGTPSPCIHPSTSTHLFCSLLAAPTCACRRDEEEEKEGMDDWDQETLEKAIARAPGGVAFRCSIHVKHSGAVACRPLVMPCFAPWLCEMQLGWCISLRV